MKRTKILGLALVAVFAMSAVGVSSASASLPAFFHCAKDTTGKFETKAKCESQTSGGTGWEVLEVAAGELIPFTAKSGVSNLYAKGGIVITCGEDESKGEVSGPKKVINVVDTFKKCKTENPTTKATCEVNSGTIVTETLSGEIGYVSKAAKTVGEDLKPPAGKPFVKLSAPCLEPTTTSVEGSVIGEVTPTNKLQKTGTLSFTVNATTKTKQTIQKLEEGETEPPKDTLSAFGTAAGFESSDAITFTSEAVDVEA